MERAETLGEAVGVSKACQALGVPRSRLYRERAARTGNGTNDHRTQNPSPLAEPGREKPGAGNLEQ